MEQDLFGYDFVCENPEDIGPTYESLRKACDLFKRSDEIKITKIDAHTMHLEGPYEELSLIMAGFCN